MRKPEYKTTPKTYEDGQREMKERCFLVPCINLNGQESGPSTQGSAVHAAKKRAIAELEIYPND